MGKSKLFGSGSGKPVNSVKVTEIAGENIPANCFVEKLSGTSSKTFSYANGLSAYFLDKENDIWLYNSNGIIYVCKGTTQTSSYTLKTFGCTQADIAILPNLKYFVFAGIDDDNIIDNYLFSWNANGVITLIDSICDADSTNSNNITCVSGIYNSNYVYFLAGKILYKYTIENGKFIEPSSTITCNLRKDSGTPLGQVTYLEGYGLLSSGTSTSTSTKYLALTSPLTGDYIWSISCKISSSRSLPLGIQYYNAVNGYSQIIDDFLYFVTGCNSRDYYFCKLNLTNGELSYNQVTATTSQTKYAVALAGNPYSDNPLEFKAFIYESNGYLKYANVDFVTNTVNDEQNIATATAANATTEARYAFIERKGTFILLQPSSIPAIVRRTTAPAHIVISTSSAIFGYTVAPIKAYEQGDVYCVDTSYPSAAYTAYGITEALATQIVDDSVDEIKQEVTM